MSVIRVKKDKNFTIMSNYHLKDKKLSLKAKGLLSVILSLPEKWDYTTTGLSTLTKENKDTINRILQELEKLNYVKRKRIRRSNGSLAGTEYTVYEVPYKWLFSLIAKIKNRFFKFLEITTKIKYLINIILI